MTALAAMTLMNVMQVHVTAMLLAATALEDTVALATTTSPATDFLVPSMTSVHLTHVTLMPTVLTTQLVSLAHVKTDTKVVKFLVIYFISDPVQSSYVKSRLVWSEIFSSLKLFKNIFYFN